MKLFDINSCPSCHSENIRLHTTYTIKTGEERTIHQCQDCLEYFSETKNTPQASLKTPLSTIRLVIDDLNEGKGINATARTDKISKNTIYNWMERIANLKEILLLYALCHQFLNRFVEGDELYTKVKENLPFDQSEGWTIVLMDRASRFIWELSCGEHDQTLFMDAMQILSQVIEQTQDLTLITDGERRYSNLLFEICRQTLHTCQVGRPQLILKEGVKVRFKNKGSQTHKKGPKRPKYQTQKRENPDTSQELDNKDIHANHLEAFNSAIRRKLSCFRRRTNMYAKTSVTLQTRLDVHWIIHNFIPFYLTTKQIPAVTIGILDQTLFFADLFKIRYA